MNAYETYIDYLALKRHFTVYNYDYVKYKGKVNASVLAFERRPDFYHFKKLSANPKAHDVLLSNLSEKPTAWIRDIAGPAGKEIYDSWSARMESLSRVVELDLKKLESFDAEVKVVDGKHPPLLKKYLGGAVCKETLVILDSLVGIFNHWDKKIDEDLVWPEKSHLLRKYSRLITFDVDKYRSMVLRTCNNDT